MQEQVHIEKADEGHVRLTADNGILREIQDHFSFFVEGYQFTPKFKNKVWDGKIRLVNLYTRTAGIGLFDDILEFCESRDYEPVYDYNEFSDDLLSDSDAKRFISEVTSGCRIDNFETRDYQLDTFVHCVRKKRALVLSPTSSGKSWMIYLLARWYDSPTLIIVDSTTAVHQMAQDFEEYGEDPSNIHKIFSGQEKYVKERIVISTWQSLQKLPEQFFDRFKVVIGDEAHHFAAKSFGELMDKITNASYRFGFTGTVKGSKTNTMQLVSIFGKMITVVTTKELMDAGHVAKLDIKCIVLQYPDSTKLNLKKAKYQKELDFIVQNRARNNFLANLTGDVKGNTLVFFNFVDKHGKVLYNMIKDRFPDKKVFFVHGGVDGEIRNEIRAEFEKNDDCIGIVSYGTFQTAVSIKNIWNLIFASPAKSRIRNLQSIGRGLRMNAKKKSVTLYDVADNLIVGDWKNHTIKHFGERISTYSEEKFKPKIYNVKLKDG